MKKTINIFLILFSTILIYSCDDEQFESNIKYVSFGSDSYSAGVDVDASTTVDVNIYTSSTASSNLVFNIDVDASAAAAGSYTVPSTVTVPSGSNEGTFTVTLSDVDLGIGVNRLLLGFTDVETGYDNGAPTTIEYIQNCAEVTATLDFNFDGFGSEVSYEITDTFGDVVLSAAEGTWSDGQASASETLILCSGRDYTFTINDSFGDGLSYPSNGSYTLTVNGTVKATGGGNYGSTESTDFDTN